MANLFSEIKKLAGHDGCIDREGLFLEVGNVANECKHNRRFKVGEKMENIRREGNAAVCNACGKIVATYYVKD